MTPDPLILQKLTYSIEYPVHYTENVFDPANPALLRALDRLDENRVHRAMVFIDSNIADASPALIQQVIQYFDSNADEIELAEEPRVIPGGEIIKNDIEVVGPLISAMVDAHLCRHSFVIIIGGGAVLDTVGLAASLLHRGVRVVRIPTTLFGQINSALGVKTAVNFDHRKNCAGTFAPPFAVVNDWQFLYTLPERDWVGGLAEAFRLAILFDPEFFDELVSLLGTLHQRRSEDMQHIIARASSLYLEVIAREGDPAEHRSGHPLDLGEWAACRLEILSQFEIPHSEALALGVLIDACYAMEQEWLDPAEFERIYTAFAQLGLPLWFEEMEQVGPDGNPALFHGIPDFQEQKGGLLTIPFPTAIGRWREEHVIDLAVMEQALGRLKEFAQQAEREFQRS